MAFPLLALGLIAGQEFLRLRRNDQREQDQKAAIGSLLGASPAAMGPPDESGQMGYSGGRGLLADPADPQRQLEFAGGIMGLPGLQSIGAQLLQGTQQRAQQGQQFGQSQAQQASQWQSEQERIREQWRQQFGLSERQQNRLEANDQTAAEQWAQQFGLSRQTAQDASARGWAGLNEQRRQFGITERRLQGAADAKGDGLPKLAPGWMYAPSAAGLVAAPVPGTEDYAKVVGTDSTLQMAQQRINRLVDMVAGVETTTKGGNKVRMGGKGTELWGEDAATYSTLRGQIISDVAKLREMGVLQQGEMDNIEKQLPDPSGWTAPFRRNASIARSYTELRDQFKAKAESHRRSNPWLVPPPPPGTRVQP